MVGAFQSCGWAHFGADPDVLDWATCALPEAIKAVGDPANAHWHQCQGTWFVGVDALPNDAVGRVGGSGPLKGAAVDVITELYGPMQNLHRAQVSVVYPGYPKPRDGESDAGFRYRLNRDAAHVDGILAEGPAKTRRLREPHAYVLGIPLTKASHDAAPLVVWDGSHKIMREEFQKAFANCPEHKMEALDITEIYQAARRRVFETCERVELPASPGEATLLHRMTVHGVAPWGEQAKAAKEGRMIAYFRPESERGIQQWLRDP